MCGVSRCGTEPVYQGVEVTTSDEYPLFQVSYVQGIGTDMGVGILGSAFLSDPLTRLTINGHQWTFAYGLAVPTPFPVTTRPRYAIADGDRTVSVHFPAGTRLAGRTDVADAPFANLAPTWVWKANGGGMLWLQEPNPVPPEESLGPYPGTMESGPVTQTCAYYLPHRPPFDESMVAGAGPL